MNVFVSYPFLGKRYEFVVDEEKSVGDFIDETTEVICEKERIAPPEDFGALICADRRTKRILARHQSLLAAEVKEGDELEIV